MPVSVCESVHALIIYSPSRALSDELAVMHGTQNARRGYTSISGDGAPATHKGPGG